MNRRWLAVFILVVLASVGSVSAVTRVQKLSEDRFMITLKKLSGYGGQGKVLRKLNVKAASLCIVAGYSWFEVKDQKSHGRGLFKTAAGTFQVKFFNSEDEGEDLLSCEALATDQEKKKMKAALAKANK